MTRGDKILAWILTVFTVGAYAAMAVSVWHDWKTEFLLLISCLVLVRGFVWERIRREAAERARAPRCPHCGSIL